MNNSKLVGGSICLVIAAGLVAANLALPPENLMFQLGDENMPWIPPLVLGIIGIALLVTSRTGQSAAVEKIEDLKVADPQKDALNKRLETMAWGSFLILIGGSMFISDQVIRGGWWSIGVGLIMLGLNAARYFNGLRMSGFTTFLGVLSLVSGSMEVIGLFDLEGALLLILLGAYLLIKPYVERRGLFGKAEQA